MRGIFCCGVKHETAEYRVPVLRLSPGMYIMVMFAVCRKGGAQA